MDSKKLDQKTMNPWPRIDAWLLANAPKIAKKLRPPLNAEGIARFERNLGRPLPPAIVQAYRAHDGIKGEVPAILGAVRTPRNAEWVRYMWWLPADDALDTLKAFRELDVTWCDSRLPIGKDAGDNVLLVDLDHGSLAAWDNESGDITPLAPDFAAWMSQLADDMEARLVAPSDDEDDDLELLERPRGTKAPAAKPVIPAGPARPARMMLELLAARGHIILTEGADLDELAAALAVALATKGGARRRAKVVAELENSPAIEEVFADDDMIGAVADEFA